MADEIISVSDLGLDKSVLYETFTEATASALAIAYLAVQALVQVTPQAVFQSSNFAEWAWWMLHTATALAI